MNFSSKLRPLVARPRQKSTDAGCARSSLIFRRPPDSKRVRSVGLHPLALVVSLIAAPSAASACIANSEQLTREAYFVTRSQLMTPKENDALGQQPLVFAGGSPTSSPGVDGQNIYISLPFLDSLACYILANTMTAYGATELFPQIWLDQYLVKFAMSSGIDKKGERGYTGPVPPMPIEFLPGGALNFSAPQRDSMLQMTTLLFQYSVFGLIFHEIGHVVEDAIYLKSDRDKEKREKERHADEFAAKLFERWKEQVPNLQFGLFPYISRYFLEAYFYDTRIVMAGVQGVPDNTIYTSPHLRVLRDLEDVNCSMVPELQGLCDLVNNGLERMQTSDAIEAFYEKQIDDHPFATYRLAQFSFQKGQMTKGCELLSDIPMGVGVLAPLNLAFCYEHGYLGTDLPDAQRKSIALALHSTNMDRGWLPGKYGVARLSGD